MYDVLNAYLENGLKIVLHRIPNVKTVACGLWINQGSCNETELNNGLSHLTEHLLLNPENKSSPDYNELISKASAEGVIYNAVTTKEYTCFHFTGLESTLQTCLSCLACIAKENRDFPESFFENEKKVVLQEATSFYSSFQQIKERTSQALWGNIGVGKIIMGDMHNIENAKQEQIQQILQSTYVPENATLVVVGNVEYASALKLIEDKFYDWKDQKKEICEDFVESIPGIYLNKGSGNSCVLSIGFRGVAYNSMSRTAVDMVVRMLGMSGLQARIIQEVRVKRGLSYTLGGFSNFYKKRGTIGFMAVCDKRKAIEVAKIIMDVLENAKENGFKEEEIEREKRIMETAMLLSIENITEHLRYIGKSSVMESGFYVENDIRAIQNIEQYDIEKVTKELLQESNMGLAVIGDCDFDKLMSTVVLQ